MRQALSSSKVRATAQSSNGFVSGLADLWFRIGAFVETPITGGGNGGFGRFDAGPMVAGATTMWATTRANATASGRSDTHAGASLERGELKVVVDNLAIAPASSTGNACARMADAIWFTNVTSSYLPVSLAMRIDGSIFGLGSGCLRVQSWGWAPWVTAAPPTIAASRRGFHPARRP
jgi:hypothetical protein